MIASATQAGDTDETEYQYLYRLELTFPPDLSKAGPNSIKAKVLAREFAAGHVPARLTGRRIWDGGGSRSPRRPALLLRRLAGQPLHGDPRAVADPPLRPIRDRHRRVDAPVALVSPARPRLAPDWPMRQAADAVIAAPEETRGSPRLTSRCGSAGEGNPAGDAAAERAGGVFGMAVGREVAPGLHRLYFATNEGMPLRRDAGAVGCRSIPPQTGGCQFEKPPEGGCAHEAGFGAQPPSGGFATRQATY